MDLPEIQLLVFVITIIILLLAISLVLFFSVFQKKKTQYLLKQLEAQKRFEEEINKSKYEIQEQALQNISWEIHDNVGQLLSVAKMQLNMMKYTVPEEVKDTVDETAVIVGKSLEELRGLAKSLNPETIKNLGLLDAITMEVDRFNRLKVIETSLEIEGEPFHLSNEKEIILFRIIQEFCNNTLKYAQSKELLINLDYKSEALTLIAEDKGVGFDLDSGSNEKGIGLINMKSRAALIGASIEFKSVVGEGTVLTIVCPSK